MQRPITNSGIQAVSGASDASAPFADLTRALIRHVGIEEFNRKYAGQVSMEWAVGPKLVLRAHDSCGAQRLTCDLNVLEGVATQFGLKGIEIQSCSTDRICPFDIDEVLLPSSPIAPSPYVIGDWNSRCILQLRNWLAGASAVPSFAIFGSGAGVSTILMDVVNWSECEGPALYLNSVAPLVGYLKSCFHDEREEGSDVSSGLDLIKILDEKLSVFTVLIVDHCRLEALDLSESALLGEFLTRAAQRGTKVIFAFPRRPLTSDLPRALHDLLGPAISDCESKWGVELNRPQERDRMTLARHFVKKVQRWSTTDLGLKQVVRACPSGSIGDLRGVVITAINWAALQIQHSWVLDGNVARAAVHGSGLIRARETASLGTPRVAIPTIEQVVCQQLDVPAERIRPNIRKPEVMIVKRLIAYLSYCLSGRSFPEIATELARVKITRGAVGHSVVLSHVRWVEAVLAREAGGACSPLDRSVKAPAYYGLTLTQIVLKLKSVLLAPHS